MPAYAYVDESDRRDYLVCAAVVAETDRDELRKALRALRRPGANRLHMAKESVEQRKRILAAICARPVSATVYVSHFPTNREGRAEIMRRIVGDLGVAGVVIESGVGQDEHDRAALYEAVRKEGWENRFSYQHLVPRSEPLLWLPDAIAWAWGAGGDWRRRVEPVVSEIVTIKP